jgi:hypothetical protein
MCLRFFLLVIVCIISWFLGREFGVDSYLVGKNLTGKEIQVVVETDESEMNTILNHTGVHREDYDGNMLVLARLPATDETFQSIFWDMALTTIGRTTLLSRPEIIQKLPLSLLDFLFTKEELSSTQIETAFGATLAQEYSEFSYRWKIEVTPLLAFKDLVKTSDSFERLEQFLPAAINNFARENKDDLILAINQAPPSIRGKVFKLAIPALIAREGVENVLETLSSLRSSNINVTDELKISLNSVEWNKEAFEKIKQWIESSPENQFKAKYRGLLEKH